MAKQIVLLLCLALCNASIQPRDLAEEAEEQLQELFTLVQGEILAAHSKLEDIAYDFGVNSQGVYENAELNLQQEHATIKSQLNTLVDLANSAGHDVSSCTNNREDILDQLEGQYRVELYVCIFTVSYEGSVLFENSKYVIDIIITKVRDIENQLRRCRGDILCISPLLTQIELYKISLVQDIEKELQTLEAQLSTLEVALDACYDAKMASYIAEANAILDDITACIDRIIG